MNTGSTTIKINPELKAEAQEMADTLGLNLSAVMNKLLKYFIKKKTIDFIDEDEVPNEKFKQIVKQARKDRLECKASPVFDNPEDAITWLHK